MIADEEAVSSGNNSSLYIIICVVGAGIIVVVVLLYIGYKFHFRLAILLTAFQSCLFSHFYEHFHCPRRSFT